VDRHGEPCSLGPVFAELEHGLHNLVVALVSIGEDLHWLGGQRRTGEQRPREGQETLSVLQETNDCAKCGLHRYERACLDQFGLLNSVWTR
jgi:hypothetical protein